MNIPNSIWRLVTRKLANEATEEELCKLDQLLKQYPDIHNAIMHLTEWWSDEHNSESDHFSFEKILKRIGETN